MEVGIGSSVTRALEHAASSGGGVRAGSGVATQRIGPRTKLRVVEAVLSGAHEENYHSHEYGDSVWVQGNRA